MMETKQLIDTLMLAVDRALSNVHTMTIAKVTGVNDKTINCRPVINRVVNGETIKLPEFVDVPPIFMQGGSSYTAHPIAIDDYCILVFTERCFDRWYNGQDFQPPLEMRMHDYSDGIALVGINPLADAITIPDVVQQTGDTNQDGNYTHQGDRTQTGDLTRTGTHTQTGDMNLTGLLTLVGDLAQTGNALISGSVAMGSAAITGGLAVGGQPGVSGSFTTTDGKTVTVTNGVITGIV